MTIIPTKTAFPIPYEAVVAFCEKYHIVKMWLFGSVLRDDFTDHSDVDVLVEFDPNHIPGWEYFSLSDELGTILGREVDLGTQKSLKARLKERIAQSSKVIYERAG
jgi:predicted nucleotidyltransferase